jgi:hypothetical protein
MITMKRTWAALVGAVAVTGAVIAVIDAADPDGGRDNRTAATVTHIGFSEAAPLDPDQSVTNSRQVNIFAAHRADAVSTLRFVITANGKVTEERLWHADRPDVITVRNWDVCETVEETTPPPRPDSLKVIVNELFGPPSVPVGAKKSAGGATTWETAAGLMRTKYTDNGGPYPDRVVEIKGPDGSSGSTIQNTKISGAAALPDWRDGWQECRPAAGPA